MDKSEFVWPSSPRRSFSPRTVGELARLAGVKLPCWWVGAYYGRDTLDEDTIEFDADARIETLERLEDVLRSEVADLRSYVNQAREQRNDRDELASARVRSLRLEDQIRKLISEVGDLRRDARARERFWMDTLSSVLAARLG